VADNEEIFQQSTPSTSTPSLSVVSRQVVPLYGQRAGWKPVSQEDYGACYLERLENVTYITVQGDGGAFPECHVAQYPLDMGRKKVRFWLMSSHSLLHFFIGFLRKYPRSSSRQRG
jgi:SNW domain-containing protein 1